jgi:hypothetical protein
VTEREDEDGLPTGSDAVAELEAFIAETEARGEPVPAEARAMLAHLKELMAAIEGLRTSFEKGEER